jgi:predicted negative regulator of RcsB-dependent stress response
MTTRERNLLVVVGVVIILGLGFNYLMNRSSETETANSGSAVAFEEAVRLLKESRNLESRNKVVHLRVEH